MPVFVLLDNARRLISYDGTRIISTISDIIMDWNGKAYRAPLYRHCLAVAGFLIK